MDSIIMTLLVVSQAGLWVTLGILLGVEMAAKRLRKPLDSFPWLIRVGISDDSRQVLAASQSRKIGFQAIQDRRE